MNAKLIIFGLNLIAVFGFVQTGIAAEASENVPAVKQKGEWVPKVSERKTVVIYVRNDSGRAALDKQVKNLEYGISSRLNNMGFGVINHDMVVRNINAYLGNPNAKYREDASRIKKMAEGDSIDNKLFEQASGLRLAEIIGADYILSVSCSSFASERKTFTGYGVKTVNTMYVFRSNYTLYEGGRGIGTAGSSITSTKSIRDNANIQVDSDDILNGLVSDSANQISALLDNQNKNNEIIAKEDSQADITIKYVIESMSFPQIIKNEKGEYIVGTDAIEATIPYVNADIDGISQTIGGNITLSRGIHAIKISQKDIVPVEKYINVTGKKGQVIAFSLQLTDEARQRWKSDMSFIERMKAKTMLSEAEAARIRGMAKMMEQSGIRYDFKVDAKEMPEVHETQSIFGQ